MCSMTLRFSLFSLGWHQTQKNGSYFKEQENAIFCSVHCNNLLPVHYTRILTVTILFVSKRDKINGNQYFPSAVSNKVCPWFLLSQSLAAMRVIPILIMQHEFDTWKMRSKQNDHPWKSERNTGTKLTLD